MNENEDFSEDTTVMLSGGGVEYSAEKAAVKIDDLIAALEAAKEDGAEFVLMSSGNYRGAQWSSIGTDYSWIAEN